MSKDNRMDVARGIWVRAPSGIDPVHRTHLENAAEQQRTSVRSLGIISESPEPPGLP